MYFLDVIQQSNVQNVLFSHTAPLSASCESLKGSMVTHVQAVGEICLYGVIKK